MAANVGDPHECSLSWTTARWQKHRSLVLEGSSAVVLHDQGTWAKVKLESVLTTSIEREASVFSPLSPLF